jgi:hypothetical protein
MCQTVHRLNSPEAEEPAEKPVHDEKLTDHIEGE